ncbi:sugar ABC transporter ATP-binding protein [Marinomonas sp. 2405UD68-3]|uniref:sugar ABC transporter ATP-binding protein n=1 Tax=Marinomonas sp. 2405UD68-3 TaxID=3391835 RepID=UPI0039C9596D
MNNTHPIEEPKAASPIQQSSRLSNDDDVVLLMKGIHKSFAGVPALINADLKIRAGEVHAIIGQNGAGKSTLIKVLNGAHKLDSGDIFFMGESVAYASPHKAQMAGISTIFQEVNLIGYRSVTENICLGHEPKRFGMVDWNKAHAHARATLARFGLDLDVERPLSSFNIAIQQLVAIARAVALDAKVVIMDEPTSSLDEREKEVLFRVIKELQATGVAILYVSHHLDELFQICDEITVMRDGQTIGQHAIEEMTKLDMVAAMLGRDSEEIAKGGTTNFASTGNVREEVLLSVESLKGAGTLRNVSFNLHKSEILGLAGLLGSGRSEVARAIFGLDHDLKRGNVSLSDKPVDFSSPMSAIEHGFGFCSEDRKEDGIIPQLSVRENLTLVLLPKIAKYGFIDEAKERQLVDDFIKRLGIKTASMEQPISQLSGGNQQKVLLARWLVTNPNILILDEPTRGIDVGAKGEIQSLIRRLADEGLTVLMISSEFEELVEGADRVIVLQDGHSIQELSNDHLTENAIMKAIAQESSLRVE